MIYYYFAADHQIWLMTLYGKDEADDLTSDQKRQLRLAIEAEIKRRAQTARRKSKRRGPNMDRRNIFDELIEGVNNMAASREGKITLRSHRVEPVRLPRVTAKTIRRVRQRLNCSRSVFARSLHINERTLEKWEQGRAKPNPQAAALILLVEQYPDTLQRLADLPAR